MSAPLCRRVWQAEADFDGYLSKVDADSFERHVATCVECAKERAVLIRLQSVAKQMPTLATAPLRRRALHNELLSRASTLLQQEPPQALTRTKIWLALAACAACVLLVLLWHQRGLVSIATTRPEPSYELLAAPGSRWHVARPGSSLRLALEQGTFTISVKKLKGNQRFALDLPDGELEVRGTRFTVRADAQHTLNVAVREGRVALRLAGHVETMLGPGDAWPSANPAELDPQPELGPQVAGGDLAGAGARSSPPDPSLDRATASSAALRAVAPPSYRNRAASRVDSKTTSSPILANSSSGDAGVPPPTAGEDFARAMSMFSRGDYGSAEQLLEAFETRYPRSSHAEDVLFLRALTRSRRGDEAGASRLAREYVRRYPAGFRIQEAETMAHEGLTHSQPGQ